MPISFQFVGKTIWVTLSGQYSLEEIRQTSVLILNDPAFTDDMNLLLDARDSTVNPSFTEVKQRAIFLRSVVLDRRGKIAIVVGDRLRYGLSRMLSIYAQIEGINIEVFMDISQARHWIEPELTHSATDD